MTGLPSSHGSETSVGQEKHHQSQQECFPAHPQFPPGPISSFPERHAFVLPTPMSSRFEFSRLPQTPTPTAHVTPSHTGITTPTFLKSHEYSFTNNLSTPFTFDMRPFYVFRYKESNNFYIVVMVPVIAAHSGEFFVCEQGRTIQYVFTPKLFDVDAMFDPKKPPGHGENHAIRQFFGEEAPSPVTLRIALREPVEDTQVDSRTISDRVYAMGRWLSKPRWNVVTYKLLGQREDKRANYDNDVEVVDDFEFY